MTDETDSNKIIWDFVETLPLTIRDGIYFLLGGYLSNLLQLQEYEQLNDTVLIRQRINDALFAGLSYGRIGAVRSLIGIFDFHFAMPRIDSPELDALIEETHGDMTLRKLHGEKAGDEWFELRKDALSEETIYSWYLRETAVKEPEIPERTVE